MPLAAARASRPALLGEKRASASPIPKRCLRPSVAVAARRSLLDGFDAFDSLFDSLERDLERAESLSDFASPRRGTRNEEKELVLPGGKGFARARSSSGRTATSSWSRSESVVVWGVEPRLSSPPATRPAAPVSPLAALGAAALVSYAAVAAKFARATSEGETRYSRKSRWRLALLWPLLAVASPGFREELGGAVLKRKKTEGGDGEATPPPPVAVEADDVIAPR